MALLLLGVVHILLNIAIGGGTSVSAIAPRYRGPFPSPFAVAQDRYRPVTHSMPRVGTVALVRRILARLPRFSI